MCSEGGEVLFTLPDAIRFDPIAGGERRWCAIQNDKAIDLLDWFCQCADEAAQVASAISRTTYHVMDLGAPCRPIFFWATPNRRGDVWANALLVGPR